MNVIDGSEFGRIMHFKRQRNCDLPIERNSTKFADWARTVSQATSPIYEQSYGAFGGVLTNRRRGALFG